MIEIILTAIAVSIALYFILKTILHKLAGNESEDPCSGCNCCSSTLRTNTPSFSGNAGCGFSEGRCPGAETMSKEKKNEK